MKKNENNQIGILLATYNGEKYIREQLDSIVNQSYTKWILYISDDNSTDSTNVILFEYLKKYPDKIIILENKNNFASAKLNFANLFRNVNKADYYVFCDQDDVWERDKLKKMLSRIKEAEKNEKKPLLVYSDLKIVDENLNVISNSLIKYEKKFFPRKDILKHFLIENYFPGCVMMFNNDLKEIVRDIYLESEMHDWWVTLVAAFLGEIIFIDEPLHLYRQHDNNTIGAKKDKNIIVRYWIRIKKMLKFSETHNIWKKYQNTVLLQAEELKKRYFNEKNENMCDLDEFIKIMREKNKLKKLILLIKNGFIPREKIRILRLVI